MGSDRPLHVLFFPFMAQGHILPMLDMARLFAARGQRSTVVTTPANAPLFLPSIDRTNVSLLHNPIQLLLIPFPSGTGLPEGCENRSSVPPHQKALFFEAAGMLRQPFCQALVGARPDCIVTDMFFPWTCDVAAELGLPRLVFYGANFFSRCVTHCVESHNVLGNWPDGGGSIVMPGLPHRVEMFRYQIMDIKKYGPFLEDMVNQVNESDGKSYGMVANSFYELEPDFADHYRNAIGRRAWHIGPMSLCNQGSADMSVRGIEISGDPCLEWLDGKSPGSVVYVCFGSISEFTASQLRELALGLEASGHPFVWVVRGGGEESTLPEGFERRVEGRGLVIRGWAPQMLILNHAAVGGFLTHCGWNSILEGISAGLPFITWPLFAEQFYNEKLIVDLLKVGFAIGVKDFTWNPAERALVEAVTIEAAVKELMGGGVEAEERRRRAVELGESARRAVEIGGSSYADMSNLIQELKEVRDMKELGRCNEKDVC